MQMAGRSRGLALFDLGIDSKLRGCDLVKLRVRDICHGEQIAPRAIIMQQKTQRPVQFEITPSTREAVGTWIKQAKLRSEDYLFPGRLHNSPHLGTHHYARVLEGVGKCHRPRCISLRYAFHAADQGLVELSADEEPESGAAIAWTRQVQEHRTLPRYRG